jgi:hypothetical protein
VALSHLGVYPKIPWFSPAKRPSPASSVANLEKKSVLGVFHGLGRLLGRITGLLQFHLSLDKLLREENAVVVRREVGWTG